MQGTLTLSGIHTAAWGKCRFGAFLRDRPARSVTQSFGHSEGKPETENHAPGHAGGSHHSSCALVSIRGGVGADGWIGAREGTNPSRIEEDFYRCRISLPRA